MSCTYDRKEMYMRLELSHKEVSKLVGVTEYAVYNWRKKHLNEDVFYKWFRKRKIISKKDEKYLSDCTLTNGEVAKIIDRSINTVRVYRKKYLSKDELSSIKHMKNDKVVGKYSRRPFTTLEIKEIINSNLNIKELAIMYERNISSIEYVKEKYKKK